MKTLARIEDNIVGILIVLATLVLTVNIILRYFFSANTTWAEEFVRYSMIWITFIGMAICFRKVIHFGVDILIKSLPEKGSNVLQIVINIVSGIFMILLIFYGTNIVLFNKGTGQITPSLEIGIFWIYLAIPVGAFLSFVHLSINTFELLKDK